MARAEDQARIREVLIALGGSPEALDGADPESQNGPVTLASRIEAHTRLTRGARKAPSPFADETAATEPSAPPIVTPTEVVLESKIEIAKAARYVARTLIHAAVALARSLPRVGGALVHSAARVVRLSARVAGRVARNLTLGLRRAMAALRRSLGLAVHVGRLFVRYALRVARSFALALPRATAALRRSRQPVRRDDERDSLPAAAPVMAWVQRRAESTDAPGEIGLVDHHRDAGARESDVGTLESQSPVYRSGRTHLRPRAGLALFAAAVAIVPVILALLLLHRHQAVVPEARGSAVTATAEAVASRTAFTDPRSYAGAMTRLALANGRTQLDGEPACGKKSTWERWTCRAKGRPSLGPFAGRWLTYRCSPSYTAQPGGPPGLMINCRPENPPPLTT